MSIRSGTRLGPFEVAAQIGAGGMGTVYRAYDPRLQRTIAIKLLGGAVAGQDACARLLREARSASALNHPHICTIYDVGEHEGNAFIAMEYIDGQPLSVLLAPGGLPMADVLRYGRQVADAITHAHERGVLHRDLKAANVIISAAGTAKVVDFGLAKRVVEAGADATESVYTTPGTVSGTMYAMPPESLRGEPANVRTDVWALGVLLHEMAAGSPPFGGHTSFELTSAILRDGPAQLPAHASSGFCHVVERCLAKNPTERYQHASAVRAALEALAEDREWTMSSDTVPETLTARPLPEPESPAQPTHIISDGQRTHVPLPPRVAAAAGHEPPVVGRDAQLVEMKRVWERVRDGCRQVIMLGGEPGIGKTRLACEFCGLRHAEGATVLFGRCDEEALVAYQPFVEALNYYVTSCPEAELRCELEGSGIGSELSCLAPGLSRRAPDLPPVSAADGEGQRYRLFDAVAALLRVMSQGRPVLLMFDDLHWADKPTLLLFRHLVRSQHDGAICIVGTYRDTELGRTHPLAELLADLRGEGTVLRLPVTGLPAAAVRDMIRAWSAPAAAREFAALVADRTGGNPLFVREILHHLDETGALSRIDSEWGVDRAPELRIPEGVKEVIGRRLSRLDETTNRTLLRAAVVGREFAVDVLGPLAEMPEDDFLDALDAAVGAGIIAEVPGAPGRFAFTHALMRQTLYGELSTARRVRLHRRVAGVLEGLQRPVASADLAYHFAEGAPAGGDVGAAIRYAVKAGETAAAGLAHEEAARFFEMALHVADLGVPEPELGRLRADLHARRARAFANIALWASARTEFGAALEFLDAAAVEARAELLLSLTTAVFFLMDIPEVERLATEALAIAERSGREDLAAAAMAWLARVQQSAGNLDETIVMDRRALARSGGRFNVALAQAPLSFYWVGRAAEAAELGRQAAEFARRSGDSLLTMFALPHHALGLAGCGQYAEAIRVFEEACEYGERHGMRPLTARAVAMTAGLHRELLDFETAEALSEQARETARSAAFVPPVVSAGIDLLLNAARRQDPGRADALMGEVEGAVSRAGGWHGWLWRLRLTQARAELALARGRLVNAVELATSAMDQSRDRRRLKYLACGLVTRAEARAALDQIRDAHDDLTAALDVARRIDDPALVLRVLAAFLRIDGTDALAAEAHATVARITLALPDSLLRRRFEDAEVVRRLGRQ